MNSRERRAIAAAKHNEQRRPEWELEKYVKWLKDNTQGQRLDERQAVNIHARRGGKSRLAALALAAGAMSALY